MNTQKYGLFCSLENLVFPHCKTTTFFPTLYFIIHPQPPTVYSLSWSTTRGNLPASKLSFWWTHEKSRESRTRKETWVRGWRARSQATRQWDTSSLLGQFSFVLLNPIVFIYLRNYLTSLVLSFPLTSSFFYIIFFGTDCHIYVSSSSKTSVESQREDHSTRIQVWLFFLHCLLCANWI